MVKKLKSPDSWKPHNALSRPEGYAASPKDFDWLQKNIPCQEACPAGTDIPGYLEAISKGEHARAYQINLADNVFPAVLGRVCTRPCEPACRHGWEGLGEPVAICFSKRSSADFLENSEPVVLQKLFDESGKSIAIVGGGAAGLATARQLALYGHTVKVFEKHSTPGGMMVQGIPHFRLPREIIAREVEQVARTGVEIVCNTEVGKDVPLSELLANHDAVVIAVGNFRPNIPDLPGKELAGIEHGLGFLQRINDQGAEEIGKRVVVVGGGFTAVDCARTALRLGADQVDMCYRRSEAEMYITPGEVEEMQREGIGFSTMVSPVGFVGEAGRVTAVQFVRVEIGEVDDSGRGRPVPIEGSEFEVAADTVLLGTGQNREASWMEEAIRAELFDMEGRLKSDKNANTSVPKLFIAGDFAIGATSLIDAVGHAKICARKIDEELMGEERVIDVAEIVSIDELSTGRTREMDDIPRQAMPHIPTGDRSLHAEVETGFAQDDSETEASRCYLCNFKFEIDNDLCIYCDRCLKAKPVENCIVKVRELKYDASGLIVGYTRSTGSNDYNMLYIDQNECIRCGACADVCPVDCIPVQKVNKRTVSVFDV